MTERVPEAYVIPIISDGDPPDDSSLELQENPRISYRLREKKVKAPSVASSIVHFFGVITGPPDSLPDIVVESL
jgi:hypothetical protein